MTLRRTPLLRAAATWIVPLTCAVVSGHLLGGRRLDLSDTRRVFTYDDRSIDGTSRIEILKATRGHAFALRLGPGFSFPYGAYAIRTASGNFYASIDATRYDSLIVEARSREQSTLRIQTHSIEPGFTDSTKVLSMVPMEAALPLARYWSRQATALSDLSIPTWWPALAGAKAGPHPHALERMARIDIQNGPDLKTGVDDTIEIREIALVGWTWWPTAILVCLSLAASGIWSWFRFRKSTTTPVPPEAIAGAPSQPVPLESRQNLERDRILEWIGTNYHREEIGVDQAGRETGIHPRRIPTILKEATGKSFPAQVNSIRLEEARRLLRSTDRTVSEIAVAVGMPNIPHFHRTFKAAVGKTPLEWREQPSPSSPAERPAPPSGV